MILIVLFCYIVSILLFFGSDNPKYEWLFILPLIYGSMLQFSTFVREHVVEYVSLAILFTTSFIRFVVTPLLMFLGGFPSNAEYYDISYFNKAILLMGYEEIVFWIVVNYTAKKIFSSFVPHTSIDLQHNYNKGILFIILLALGLVIIYPQLLSRFYFVPFLTGEEGKEVIENTLSGGYGLLVFAGRFFAILSILLYCYKRYLFSESVIWIYVSLLVIGINSLVVNDHSRFGILIPAASFVYFLLLLYPSYRKNIVIGSTTVIGFSLAYTTFIKMFSEARGGADKGSGISDWADTFQVYFQNVSDVVIGLAASNKLVLSPFFSLINDAISNLPILSHLSNSKISSLTIFNFQYYCSDISVDRILPNVCAGYYYFGVLGAPVIVCFVSFWGIKFDAQARASTDFFKKFLFIFASISCCMPNMIFYSMTLSAIFSNFLIMYLLLIFAKYISRIE